MSLRLITFWRDVVNAIFLKYSKEGRLSSSYVDIWNVSSDVYYDDTKHYQMESEWKPRQAYGVQKQLPTPLREI